jgi:hypothetical protein
MDAPSYLPYPAIKSLIRSAWLAMKPEQRQNAKYLRQIIQDQVSLSRVQWLECLFPVKLDAFIFEIWEKKPESSIISSPFIIRLMMANYCIVWCCPDTVTNQHISSLLPLFESSIAPTGVEFLLSAAEDLSRRIERPNFHFKFTFGELIRGA